MAVTLLNPACDQCYSCGPTCDPRANWLDLLQVVTEIEVAGFPSEAADFNGTRILNDPGPPFSEQSWFNSKSWPRLTQNVGSSSHLYESSNAPSGVAELSLWFWINGNCQGNQSAWSFHVQCEYFSRELGGAAFGWNLLKDLVVTTPADLLGTHKMQDGGDDGIAGDFFENVTFEIRGPI